jgi:hypothetical protein
MNGDIEVSVEGHTQVARRAAPALLTYAQRFKGRHSPASPPTSGQLAVWAFTVEALRRQGHAEEADELDRALALYRPKPVVTGLQAALDTAKKTYADAIARGEVARALELKSHIAELEARVDVEADMAKAKAADAAQRQRQAVRVSERESSRAREEEQRVAAERLDGESTELAAHLVPLFYACRGHGALHLPSNDQLHALRAAIAKACFREDGTQRFSDLNFIGSVLSALRLV